MTFADLRASLDQIEADPTTPTNVVSVYTTYQAGRLAIIAVTDDAIAQPPPGEPPPVPAPEPGPVDPPVDPPPPGQAPL